MFIASTGLTDTCVCPCTSVCVYTHLCRSKLQGVHVDMCSSFYSNKALKKSVLKKPKGSPFRVVHDHPVTTLVKLTSDIIWTSVDPMV